MSKLKIAKEIIKNYNLKSNIIYTNNTNLVNYIQDTDTIIICKKYHNSKEFLLSLLHEIKHAIDCKKLGKRGYVKKYNQASNLAINQGLNHYTNNKWEIKAERWAKNNFKKWEHLIK